MPGASTIWPNNSTNRVSASAHGCSGREHADVAASINNLAVLYENQVRYPKAEVYYRTALDIREKALGGDHVDYDFDLGALFPAVA